MALTDKSAITMNVAPEQGLERMKARARALRKRGPSVAGDISANPRETFGGISIRDRFGKLTVIRRAENKGQHARWECVCDCTPGQTIVVRGDHLRDGSTLSCGCAQKQYQEIRITKAEKSLRLKNFGKVRTQRSVAPMSSESLVRGAACGLPLSFDKIILSSIRKM